MKKMITLLMLVLLALSLGCDFTPTEDKEVGSVWLTPGKYSPNVGETFTTDIKVNSGDQNLSAYGITLSYDANVITPASDNLNTVTVGIDGFIVAANTNVLGKVSLTGFDVTGKNLSSTSDFLSISWTAEGAGQTEIVVDIDNLTTETYKTIGTPKGWGSVITAK